MARVTFISVFLLTLISLGLALVRTPNYAADIKRAQQLQGSSKNKRNSVPAGYVAAPYYPTPPGGWVSNWTAAYAKAQKVVANMTLAEKVNVTTGVGENMGRCVGNTGSALRFGIPNLCLQDSALGVADTDNVTAFPAGITVGATWNKALAYARGLAMGAEARGKGVNIQLGPVVGPMGRKPRGGRNWEGFGADPVLQAWAGAETVKGIQANGVIATIKHFIGNEQEAYRMDIIPHGLVSS
jgi:beta-glucosidase